MNLPRNHFYCGLTVVGFASGTYERVSNAIERDGLMLALLNTLDVSVVVWAAGIAAVALLLQAEQNATSRKDIAVGAVASAAFLVPVPALSWLGLGVVAAQLAMTSPHGNLRKAAVVLGAATIPMFWSRLLFAMFSTPILALDAKLVSWIVGTESDGNAIPFANGSGVLFLEPACSSLTNVSLALLAGVLLTKLCDLQWSTAVVGTIAAACAATVAINVVRLSAIGLLPASYDTIHGAVGATTAGWIINIVVVGIYALGLRSNAPADP